MDKCRCDLVKTVSFPGAGVLGICLMNPFKATALFFALISGGLLAQVLHPYEPTPFRREQLDGRPFRYDGMAFQHRLSYQPMPYLGSLRPVPDRVLQGTAGSISRREFYVRIEASAHIPLDGPLFSGYRFRRDEDFDGRFDWNLVGLGLEWGQWRIAYWGDVVSDKEAIDTHLDLSWKDPGKAMFRFVWVMPEMIFNRKNPDAFYETRPHSLFLRGERWLTDRVAIKGFLQVNNRMELRDRIAALVWENQATSGGGSLEILLTEDVAFELYAEGLTGDRVQQGLDEPLPSDFEFDRLFRSATAELRRVRPGGALEWAGLRYLSFEERWSGINFSDFDSTENRRETTLYWGREIPMDERRSFIPALFLGYHDIEQRGSRASGVPDGGEWTTADFYGKFAPAWRWILREDTGAHLTLLLSARLHRAAFGGGNVQVVFPF